MKKRWIAIGIWSIGAILIGTGQLNGCLGPNEDRGMISCAAGQSQASKTIQNKIEKSNKTTRSLEEEKKTLKKEVASLENKKNDDEKKPVVGMYFSLCSRGLCTGRSGIDAC